MNDQMPPAMLNVLAVVRPIGMQQQQRGSSRSQQRSLLASMSFPFATERGNDRMSLVMTLVDSAVQIGSERAWQRRAGCERADCDTNNAASLKEARVDHSEGGVCVTSIQGGVERRNSNISASI